MSNAAKRRVLSAALALALPWCAAAQIVAPSGAPSNGGPADPESPGAAVIRPLESIVPNPRSKRELPPLSAADERFLDWARRTAQGRVDIGRLAAAEGAHPCVRKYAGQVVESHLDLMKELDVIAASRRMSPDNALDKADRALLADLQRLSGAAFDHRFADEMRSAQEQDLARLRRERERADDAELNALARRAATAIEDQVAMASRLTTMVGDDVVSMPESALPQGATAGCSAF